MTRTHPPFPPSSQPTKEPPSATRTIQSLDLQPHPEGGYYQETFRHPQEIPIANGTATRSASTRIHYMLTPGSPLGAFHRNKSRTLHTLHRGRGRYVVIHADERKGGKAPVEEFVVGHDVERGEKVEWVVEGGKWKGSYLLPEKEHEDDDGEERGLLITETVEPGFAIEDHDFLSLEEMKELLTPEQVEDMAWMLRENSIEKNQS
ncbi:hypothetical protein AtubIFM56815_001362 [Aspergillus tubingensis]|uniref:DUF985 domain-containing protein n=1 Tax=Aspergillus tubingensis TaxID=5068 RepID=A0A9W6AER3_ASPTU|nr:hypothetical protein AtubIFM56815_001362 [Aspergillus tubingensis]